MRRSAFDGVEARRIAAFGQTRRAILATGDCGPRSCPKAWCSSGAEVTIFGRPGSIRRTCRVRLTRASPLDEGWFSGSSTIRAGHRRAKAIGDGRHRRGLNEGGQRVSDKCTTLGYRSWKIKAGRTGAGGRGGSERRSLRRYAGVLWATKLVGTRVHSPKRDELTV